MPRQPVPSTLTAEALLAAKFLTPTERAALATLDPHELWRSGQHALAVALNPFVEFAHTDHVLTPAELCAVERLRDKLGLGDDA